MNQLTTLEPREKPLSVEDYQKLETLLASNYKILTDLVSVPLVDTHGEVYGWRKEARQVGIAITSDTLDPRVIQAVQRPATKKAIGVHLTRLAAHKHNARGGIAFQVIVEDACRDLEGCSEWAVMKAYDRLRNEPGDFFPSLKTIVDTVKWFDAGAKSMGEKKETKQERPAEQKQDRTEGKYRVAQVMHDAGLPHDKEFCRGCGA